MYNVANTLHMLGRDSEAKSVLVRLIDTPDPILRAGCPDAHPSPNSFRLDAFFLLFCVSLELGESWDDAYQYAQKHLRRRRRGLRSAWSKKTIQSDIEELRQEYAETI